MILIDSREQWKEEIQNKLQAQHVNAQILKLENYADYVLTSDNKEVQNTVAIQRKTIGEVLSQFKDIQMRLPELQKYGAPWLLVEESGIFINRNGMLMSKRGKLLYETGVKAQSYYNFLHSVQRSGVSVKTTLNWEQSVWWLYSLHSYIQREHISRLDRKYTQKEELLIALQGVPKMGTEKAQQLYVACNLLHEPFDSLNSKGLKQETPVTNVGEFETPTLKAFDMLLKKVKSVLRTQQLSKKTFMKQLKSRITRDEVLLKLFINTLIEVGYLKKEKKGKQVYYSIRYKNAQKNIEDESEIKNVSREEGIATVEKEHQEWLEEIEEDWKTIEK